MIKKKKIDDDSKEITWKKNMMTWKKKIESTKLDERRIKKQSKAT
jgi:hypothetical protein